MIKNLGLMEFYGVYFPSLVQFPYEIRIKNFEKKIFIIAYGRFSLKINIKNFEEKKTRDHTFLLGLIPYKPRIKYFGK